jgi:hypothetical protein
VGKNPEATELLHVETVALKDLKEKKNLPWNSMVRSRTEFQDFYHALLSNELNSYQFFKSSLKLSFTDLSPLEQARNEFENALSPINNEWFFYTVPQ